MFESDRLNNEDDNPVFDGLRVYAQDEPLGIDSARSGWIMVNNTNLIPRVHKTVAFSALPFAPAPLDVHILWNSTEQDTPGGTWLFPGDTLLDNFQQKTVITPFRIVNVIDTSELRVAVNNTISDKVWRPGKELAFLTPLNFNPPPNAIMFSVTFSP